MSMKQTPSRTTTHSYRRSAVGILLLLLLLLVGLALYPPARAWAQGILARFGPFFFTNAPSLPEQHLTRTPEEPPTPTPGGPSPGADDTFQDVMTREEAQALVSFDILVPQYLPEGMHLSSFSVSASFPDVSGNYTYTDGTNPGEVVIIRQFPFAGESLTEFPIGDAPTTEVAVRGQKGLWVEDANLGLNPEQGQPIKWSFLIWQEQHEGARFLLWMFTHNLPQTEMLKIAESLAP